LLGSVLAAPEGFYRDLFEERFGKVHWFSEGVSETVAICEHPNGHKWIQYSDGRGASGTDSFAGGWLYAHLPLLLHPDPRAAVVICFGTGNTLGAASLHDLEVLEGVELSSEVVKASHYFKQSNHDVANNHNVNIIIEDGRNYLLATEKRYDLISEEPPMVHTAGVVNLYSQDFYELCSDRLTDDGIMAVWLATWEIEGPEMEMLIQAFVQAFPYASLWDSKHPREWLLVGSKKPLEIDLDVLERRMSRGPIARDLDRIGITSSADLLALYLKGRDFLAEFAGTADPVIDDKTVVDYRIPRYARANFGLGERVTSGLKLSGVGEHGFRSETRLRDFNSVYAFRESVEPLIVSYGAHDPQSFLESVRQKQLEHAYEDSLIILDEIRTVARDVGSTGAQLESLEILENGLRLVPPEASEPLLMEMAALYTSMGRSEESRGTLETLTAIDAAQRQRANQVMMRRSGLIAIQHKDYGRAAAIFQRLTTSPQAQWNDWIKYGKALFGLNQYHPAAEALQAGLLLNPDSPEGRQLLGLIALRTSDYDEALVQFEISCRLDPTSTSSWYGYVYAAWRSQGDEAALERLLKARDEGIDLGSLFRRDWAAWKTSGPRLLEVIKQEVRSGRSPELRVLDREADGPF
jgi:spermidine synthase